MKKWPKRPRFPPLQHCLFSLSLHLSAGLKDNPYESWQEVETWAQFSTVHRICRHSSSLLDISEEKMWREIILAGITMGSKFAVCFTWKKKWWNVQLHTNWWSCNQWFGWSGTWKKHNWKLVTRKSGTDKCRQTFLNGQKRKRKWWRYLLPMWLLTKGWPQYRKF